MSDDYSSGGERRNKGKDKKKNKKKFPYKLGGNQRSMGIEVVKK